MVDPAPGAVILAGGAGRRLGGADKPALIVGGRTLLDTAIEACSGCTEIVVVGPPRPTSRPVHWTTEEPPGGGPVAALAAGLDALPATVQTVVVLAADLPSITDDVAYRLSRVLERGSADAAIVVDGNGRRQPLTAVYTRSALAAALTALGDPWGQSVQSLLDRLRVTTLADPSAGEDIDTAGDLARWVEHGHSGRAGEPHPAPDAPAARPAWKEQDMAMDTWIAALCERLDVPIDDVDVSAILDLAKDAAHNVERPAAPVTAFVAGYAAATQGGGSAAVESAVEAAADLAAEWSEQDTNSGAGITPTLDATSGNSGAGPPPPTGTAETTNSDQSSER